MGCRRKLLLALVLGLVLAVGPTMAAAQTTSCGAGQTPRFAFGFAMLKGAVGDPMGDPLTCEFADPNGSGDTLQRTTSGLAFYRKSTNTPTFTNGGEHWALTSAGLLEWSGPSVDPPIAAVPEIEAPFASGFMNSCTQGDSSREIACQCMLQAIEQRYSIADVFRLLPRLSAGDVPPEFIGIALDCAV